MDSIKFVMVSVGDEIKTVTISRATWKCKSLDQLFKAYKSKASLTAALKVGYLQKNGCSTH